MMAQAGLPAPNLLLQQPENATADEPRTWNKRCKGGYVAVLLKHRADIGDGKKEREFIFGLCKSYTKNNLSSEEIRKNLGISECVSYSRARIESGGEFRVIRFSRRGFSCVSGRRTSVQSLFRVVSFGIRLYSSSGAPSPQYSLL